MTPAELTAALQKCVRCGRCLGLCPVYRLTGWEGHVTRGKLALLLADIENQGELNGRLKDLLTHCLLCGACAEGCASGVKGDELIRAGRALTLGDGGLARLQGLLTRDLLGRGLVARGLVKGQRLFLRDVPADSGLHFRFPMPIPGKDRWLPKPARRDFLSSPLAKRHALVPAGPGPLVALFVGCVANYLRPQSAVAAIRVLEAAGARVIVPPTQACCGKPAAGAGDDKSARYLAERNLAALAACDLVVTFCATCSSALKETETFTDHKLAAALAPRIHDLSDLLVNTLSWRPREESRPDQRNGAKPKRVFYHDPCHLRRKQKIFKEPRTLLAALPGVELVGAEKDPICCGYGGVFNLWHHDLSRAIFRNRAEDLTPTAPDLIATACSGCWLQFQDGTRHLGLPVQVRPLVEILAEQGLPRE